MYRRIGLEEAISAPPEAPTWCWIPPWRELIGAQAANLVEYDGTLLHQRASDGSDPEPSARVLATFPLPPGPEMATGRVVRSSQAIHIPDLQADMGISQPSRTGRPVVVFTLHCCARAA
jgi:hypothetical protein